MSHIAVRNISRLYTDKAVEAFCDVGLTTEHFTAKLYVVLNTLF